MSLLDCPGVRTIGVSSVDIGAGVVLYDSSRGHYHALDHNAATVWRATQERTTVAEIAAHCKLEHEVVVLVLTELAELGLLQNLPTPLMDRRELVAKLIAAGFAIPVIASISAPHVGAAGPSDCGTPGGSCGTGDCCPPPTECCAQVCLDPAVDYVSDPNHCGGCAIQCVMPTNGSVACIGGYCQLSCDSGFGLCPNDTCVLLGTTTDCTACGDICPGPASGNGEASCDGVNCGIQCNFGFGECEAGDCVDTTSSPDHCGSSCSLCPDPSSGSGVAICVDGSCAIACDDHFKECVAGACNDLSQDGDNCGDCGNVCDTANGSYCDLGTCT